MSRVKSGTSAVTADNGCRLEGGLTSRVLFFNHNNWDKPKTVFTERLYDDDIDQGRLGVVTFMCKITTTLVVTLTKDYSELDHQPNVFLDHYDFVNSVGAIERGDPTPKTMLPRGNNGLIKKGDSTDLMAEEQQQTMTIMVSNNDIAGYALRECIKQDSNGKD